MINKNLITCCLATAVMVTATHSMATYVYVTNSGNEYMSEYAVADSGSLSGPNDFKTKDLMLSSIAVSGGFAYATNTNSIITYTVNSKGKLQLPFYAIPTGAKTPESIVLSPSASCAYVINNDNSISAYKIVNGKLTSVNGITPGERIPNSIAISPSGTSAYVAYANNGGVDLYSISNCQLTSKDSSGASGQLIATASLPSLLPDVSGSAYVVNASSIIEYNILPYCKLESRKSSALVSSGPNSITISPNGSFVYVTYKTIEGSHISNISSYRISAAGTFISGPTPNPLAVEGPMKIFEDTAYVINPSAEKISTCTIDEFGPFSCRAALDTGAAPTSLAVSP